MGQSNGRAWEKLEIGIQPQDWCFRSFRGGGGFWRDTKNAFRVNPGVWIWYNNQD